LENLFKKYHNKDGTINQFAILKQIKKYEEYLYYQGLVDEDKF